MQFDFSFGLIYVNVYERCYDENYMNAFGLR